MPAGDLGFSVLVFVSCAVVCLAVLLLRRARLGYELGGPGFAKAASATFLVGLWGVYVGLSVMAEYGMLPEALTSFP